jgi:hypothetical protein
MTHASQVVVIGVGRPARETARATSALVGASTR